LFVAMLERFYEGVADPTKTRCSVDGSSGWIRGHIGLDIPIYFSFACRT